LGLALLAALGLAAVAVDVCTAVPPLAFGAVLPDAFGAVAAAALGASVTAARVTPFMDVPLAERAVVRAAAVLAAPRVVVRARTGAAPLADSPLAASFSEATAVSSALVALVIAASALLSALAEVPALDAAVFSRVAAEVTLVAATETVRGVAVLDLLAPVLVAAVLLVVDRAVVRVLLVTVAGLAAAVRVAGLLAASVVPGTVAVVFVGTDLPLDMDQLRGRHSTESNLLHLATRKNNGGASIFMTLRYFSPDGSSSATIRSASCGDPPRPTATPIR
jgi:hypothetical protein